MCPPSPASYRGRQSFHPGFSLPLVPGVDGHRLAYHVLGQMVSQQARIKLAKLDVGSLVDHHPLEPRVRELTGCTVIAVERAEEVIMDIPPDFVLVEGDALYVCGTVNDFDHFYVEVADSRS